MVKSGLLTFSGREISFCHAVTGNLGPKSREARFRPQDFQVFFTQKMEFKGKFYQNVTSTYLSHIGPQL